MVLKYNKFYTLNFNNFFFKKFFFFNNFFFKVFRQHQIQLKVYKNIPKTYLHSIINRIFFNRFFSLKSVRVGSGFFFLRNFFKINILVKLVRFNFLTLFFFKKKKKSLNNFFHIFLNFTAISLHMFFHSTVFFFFKAFFFNLKLFLNLFKKPVIYINNKIIKFFWKLLSINDFVQFLLSFSFIKIFTFVIKFKWKYTYWMLLNFSLIKHFFIKNALPKTSFKKFWRTKKQINNFYINSVLTDHRSATLFYLCSNNNNYFSSKWVNWWSFGSYNWKYII